MKTITLLSTALSIAVSLPAFAGTPAANAETPQHKDVMAKCEKKAKEHKISEAEMQSYISNCISKHTKKEQPNAATPAKKAMPTGE